MNAKRKLNLRDLGNIGSELVPQGMFLRGGKLNVLTPAECAELCKRYHIKCVIDLRTTVESAEFPDPIPEGVEFIQIPLLKNATVGITHETGSDPIDIVRSLRHDPVKLKAMIPDFEALYTDVVTDPYCRGQLDKAVATLRQNAEKGICTLYHCTAGKDRTGVVTMALLKSYGVSNETIIRDFMRTNRYAFLPTLKKSAGIALLTRNWNLVKTTYRSFMADRKLIELAIRLYEQTTPQKG